MFEFINDLISSPMISHTSSKGNVYQIRRESPLTRDERCEMLDLVDENAKLLIAELVKNHSNKCYTPILKSRYGKYPLSETEPTSTMVAYTSDKAEIALCMVDIATNTLEDKNTLMYVFIHELAHMAINHIGHPPEFWDAFREICKVAVSIGIYRSEDYAEKSTNYCAMKINSNVLNTKATGTDFNEK